MNIKIFLIALRNVLKNKRRSLLNMMTFAINVVVILCGLGIIKGQYEGMFEKMISLSSGHFKIYAEGYPEEKRRLPLDMSIRDPQKVIDAIKGAPGFTAASARILHTGIVSNTVRKMNVVINGIDIMTEKKILTAYDKIDGGVIEKGPEILMGKKLAEIMGLKSPAPLLLYSQTVHNANNLVDAGLKGIYTVGFDFLEKVNVFVPYSFAEKFFDMKGRATEIIVRVKDMDSVPAAKIYIQGVLTQQFPGLVLYDWKDENTGLVETAKSKTSSYVVFGFVLLFLAFFIITNTMTMTVFERTAEIGTLRAMGFEKHQIRAMFLAEGALLGFFGVLLGFAVSAPLVYYLNVHGMSIDPKILRGMSIPIESTIKATNTWVDWAITGLICFAAGVIGAFFPARLAAETKIVDSLKKGVR